MLSYLAHYLQKLLTILFRKDHSDSDSQANSLDEKHSQHSLSLKNKMKSRAKDRVNTGMVHDSDVPPISDSGSARMKAILANPFRLSKDVMDPLLLADYVGLPPLRFLTSFLFVFIHRH